MDYEKNKKWINLLKLNFIKVLINQSSSFLSPSELSTNVFPNSFSKNLSKSSKDLSP